MLNEIRNVRQVHGEPGRRWFSDSGHDLIVWYGDSGQFEGFQFCYDKGAGEKALTWRRYTGWSHKRVDDGESRGGHQKMTPILVPDGVVDVPEVLRRFDAVSGALEPDVVDAVRTKLVELSGSVASHRFPESSCYRDQP